jgi:vacuole morphology and inheritance protein 14
MQVEFGPMVEILIGQCDSKERFNRLMAITWVHEFVLLGREKLVEFYSALLGAIMCCISDQELEIRENAENANHDLLELVKSTTEIIDLKPLHHRLTTQLTNSHEPTRMVALRWICMLLKKSPTQMERCVCVCACAWTPRH